MNKQDLYISYIQCPRKFHEIETVCIGGIKTKSMKDSDSKKGINYTHNVFFIHCIFKALYSCPQHMLLCWGEDCLHDPPGEESDMMLWYCDL